MERERTPAAEIPIGTVELLEVALQRLDLASGRTRLVVEALDGRVVNVDRIEFRIGPRQLGRFDLAPPLD